MKKLIKSSINSTLDGYQAVAQISKKNLIGLDVISYKEFKSRTKLRVGDNLIVNGKIAKVGSVFRDDAYKHKYYLAYDNMSLGHEEIIHVLGEKEKIILETNKAHITEFKLENVDTNKLVIDVTGDLLDLSITPYRTDIVHYEIIDDIKNLFPEDFEKIEKDKGEKYIDPETIIVEHDIELAESKVDLTINPNTDKTNVNIIDTYHCEFTGNSGIVCYDIPSNMGNLKIKFKLESSNNNDGIGFGIIDTPVEVVDNISILKNDLIFTENGEFEYTINTTDLEGKSFVFSKYDENVNGSFQILDIKNDQGEIISETTFETQITNSGYIENADFKAIIKQDATESNWIKYQLVARNYNGVITVNGVEQIPESIKTIIDNNHIIAEENAIINGTVYSSNSYKDSNISINGFENNTGVYEFEISNTSVGPSAINIDMVNEFSIEKNNEYMYPSAPFRELYENGCSNIVYKIIIDTDNDTFTINNQTFPRNGNPVLKIGNDNDNSTTNFDLSDIPFTKTQTTFTTQDIDTDTLEIIVKNSVERIDVKTFIREEKAIIVKDTNSMKTLIKTDLPYILEQDEGELNFTNYKIVCRGISEDTIVKVNDIPQTIEKNISNDIVLETTNDIYDIIRYLDYSAISKTKTVSDFEFTNAAPLTFKSSKELKLNDKIIIKDDYIGEIQDIKNIIVENNIEKEYVIKKQKILKEDNSVSFIEDDEQLQKLKVKKIVLNNFRSKFTNLIFNNLKLYHKNNEIPMQRKFSRSNYINLNNGRITSSCPVYPYKGDYHLYHILSEFYHVEFKNLQHHYNENKIGDNDRIIFDETLTIEFHNALSIDSMNINPMPVKNYGFYYVDITLYNEDDEILLSKTWNKPNDNINESYRIDLSLSVDIFNKIITDGLKIFQLPTLNISYFDRYTNSMTEPVEKIFNDINITDGVITYLYNDIYSDDLTYNSFNNLNTNKIIFKQTNLDKIIANVKKIKKDN